MIAYILPTRNRPESLARTLGALGSLPAHDAEVIVADNASAPQADVPTMLDNGLRVTLLRRPRNEGAAARNEAARAADPSRRWLVMLDDDSHPISLGFLHALDEQPDDVAAVCAEIFLAPTLTRGHSTTSSLPMARRESGGLPEVPIGCAVAYRRDAFLGARIGETTGYDRSFGFYGEEYDLAARLILAGQRIVFDRRFGALHEKSPANRSMDAILRRLVRNNCWVMRRYAPCDVRSRELRRTIGRYASIAARERALVGYAGGLAQTLCTLHAQVRQEMNGAQWERFTGKAACRRGLLQAWTERRFRSAVIIAPGKNEHVVREALAEIGVAIVPDSNDAEAWVIGTLSPGPALDAFELAGRDCRIVAPWPCAPTLDQGLDVRACGVGSRAAA